MYDVTAQFFPQFLTFKMADEVTREDVPRNCMFVDQIRLYQDRNESVRVTSNRRLAFINTHSDTNRYDFYYEVSQFSERDTNYRLRGI